MREPVLRNRWLDASGGLGYHMRAWRYRKRLWAPFIEQVGAWLREWRPPSDTLVLVGPSAGYALDTEFLQRFSRCVMLEPDPLARWLLRRRFASLDWQHAAFDVFADGGLDALQRHFPSAAIVFCNVIGQAMDAHETARWRPTQCAALRGHHWASWHDVFSSAAPPTRLPTEHDAALAPDAASAVAARAWRGQGCAVVDHGTFGWLPGARHALWHLAPAQWHVTGWVTHTPQRSGT